MVPSAKRRWFFGLLAVVIAAMLASSGWILWPVVQEYRAIHRVVREVRRGGETSVSEAVKELGKYRGQGVDAVPYLVQLMSSESGGVRWRAVYAIAELGDTVARVDPEYLRKRVVPELIKALADEPVRIRAALALGKIGRNAEAAVPALVDALGHAEPYFNGNAGHALARIGEPATDPLLALAAEGDGQRSLRAIEVLGEMGPDSSDRRIQALVAAFQTGNLDIRIRAAAALSSCGRPAVPALIKLLKTDGGMISKALGEMGTDALDAIPTLVEKIAESPNGDSTSANAIGRIGGTTELVKALDVEPARYSILLAIQRQFATSEVIPVVLRILQTDRRNDVRRAATWVLGRMRSGAAEAVPTLHQLLDEPTTSEEDIRNEVVSALGQIGPAANSTVPTLVKLIQSDEPDYLRNSAALALATIDPHHALVVPSLIEIFTHGSYVDRSRAAGALRALGPAAAPAVPTLVRELRVKGEPHRVQLALAVLEMIGPDASDAVPALIELLDSNERGFRVSAAQALGFIGPAAKSAIPRLRELVDPRKGVPWDMARMAIQRIDPNAMEDQTDMGPWPIIGDVLDIREK
jgi:HEAT repeat protein